MKLLKSIQINTFKFLNMQGYIRRYMNASGHEFINKE